MNDIKCIKNPYYNATIVLFIIIFILIGIILWFIYRVQKVVSKVEKVRSILDGNFDGNLNNGIDLDINTCITTGVKWNGKSCDCVKPFYGPSCDFEMWDPKFYAFGVGNDAILDYTIGPNITTTKTYTSDNKYDKNSCSALSLADENSIGFVYENNICNIIGDNINITGDIIYDPTIQSKIYIKNERGPNILDKVIVLSKDNVIKRYYINRPNDPEIWSITPGSVIVVTIDPDTVINSSSFTGIWSRKPFDASDFDSMLNRPIKLGYYVDNNENNSYKLTLPPLVKLSFGKYYLYIT